MSKPTTMFCGRTDLESWLEQDFGFSPNATRKLIDTDVIERIYLPGRSYAMYSPAQVERDVLSGLNAQKNGEKPQQPSKDNT